MERKDITEYPFDKEFIVSNGYRLFPLNLENDDHLLFHGAELEKLDVILREGLRPNPPLVTISFGNESSTCLSHLMTTWGGTNSDRPELCIIAYRVDDLARRQIIVFGPDRRINTEVHSYRPDACAYCIIPNTYKHI